MLYFLTDLTWQTYEPDQPDVFKDAEVEEDWLLLHHPDPLSHPPHIQAPELRFVRN